MLTRETILSIRPRVDAFDVPEWGGSVHLRPLTVADSGAVAEAYKVDPLKGTAEMIVRSVCDADGVPLFHAGDVDAILAGDAKAVRRLTDEILARNGMTPESRAELKNA